jgi:hypothetical protein
MRTMNMTKLNPLVAASRRINRRQWIARVVGGAVASRLSLRASVAANASSFEQVEQQLGQWERLHPKLLRIEVAGKSVQGRPVFAAIVTDSETADENKEHVLLAALHSGVEKGATTSALYLMNWLLSGDAQAREILRRQVIVVMPVVNPDGYVKPAFVNDHGFDAYLNWTADGPEQPAKMPEAMAVQAMLDRYQPEVFCDVHGNDCSFPGYLHFEGHVNNPWLRSYEPEIERLMDEAALKEGFPTHRGEPDEQRLPAGNVTGLSADKLSRKRPRAFAGTYCYNRYHSIVVATENAWERSFFLRHRRLLEIGNEVWPGEFYPGYPTRTILTWSHLVAVYGQTAAQRRRSRVELWNKQGQIIQGFSKPQRAGFILFVCATTRAAAEKWLGDGTLKSL